MAQSNQMTASLFFVVLLVSRASGLRSQFEDEMESEVNDIEINNLHVGEGERRNVSKENAQAIQNEEDDTFVHEKGDAEDNHVAVLQSSATKAGERCREYLGCRMKLILAKSPITCDQEANGTCGSSRACADVQICDGAGPSFGDVAVGPVKENGTCTWDIQPAARASWGKTAASSCCSWSGDCDSDANNDSNQQKQNDVKVTFDNPASKLRERCPVYLGCRLKLILSKSPITCDQEANGDCGSSRVCANAQICAGAGSYFYDVAAAPVKENGTCTWNISPAAKPGWEQNAASCDQNPGMAAGSSCLIVILMLWVLFAHL